jgi:NCAIR mutase (PurE)-related protein
VRDSFVTDTYRWADGYGPGMREILDALAAGELTPEEAQAKLQGYAATDAGRFDATRERRSGVPEAVLAEGKTTDEVVSLAETSINTTGRAIVTRLDDVAPVRDTLRESVPDADLTVSDRAGVVVAHGPTFDRPSLAASVGVVTGGTADAVPATEAAVIAREMGATVSRIDDVGVASLSRVTDQLPVLRDQDVLVVVAGREGALPTVVAGLVDVPVIAVPGSTGYGHGGDGEAALAGLLQSCTALTVVNIDAGFTAGAQAGLIARQLDAERTDV